MLEKLHLSLLLVVLMMGEVINFFLKRSGEEFSMHALLASLVLSEINGSQ